LTAAAEWFAIDEDGEEAADGERALGVSTSVTIRLEDDTLHRKQPQGLDVKDVRPDVEELDGDDRRPKFSFFLS